MKGGYNMAKRYQQEKLNEISFPLGGIGSGCVGLAGNGRLVDWQIFNRPDMKSVNGYSHLAVKAERGGRVLDARVLNGDFPPPLSGGETSGLMGANGFGHGPDRCTMAGVPHFLENDFTADFPIAQLAFWDKNFPGKARLRAFNPLIPSNSEDSSLPAAFFEVEIENDQAEATDYTVSFAVNNPFAPGAVNRYIAQGDIQGLFLDCPERDHDDPAYGNLCLATDGEQVSYQEYWYRGGWFDGLNVYWHDFTQPGAFRNRSYAQPSGTPKTDRMRGFDMCTLACSAQLEPGEKKTFRFVLSWSCPNYENYWNPQPGGVAANTWKNYYATRFADSQASAAYALQNWSRLYEQTRRFTQALGSSTLPAAALEAAGFTLSVLHSPTVLRLTDGSFYGWEGCNAHEGSCEGSCTHVWNYAYALPYLFPDLERSMRDVHLRYDKKPGGGLGFRTQLPLGRAPWDFRPCADGQFGDIIKCYRDWKLCGDDNWLKGNWPTIKQAIEWAWSPENFDRWDPDKSGVLTGRQHHTLDMELFGPNSWLTGLYLAALKAGAAMAEAVGEPDTAREYREIFARGKKWMDENLFNGSYYQQKVDIRDKSQLEAFGADAVASYWNDEAGQVKYQIGEGISIDQVLAQWHANLCGLGEIYDPGQLKTALKSMYEVNYHPSFRNYFNACRNYALNDESGITICAWPQGKEKPLIPVPYAEEVMTGFEYAAAALMVMEGMEKEGMRLVKSVRSRYDGEKRNPFNEIECGSYYARAMASFSLLPAYEGFSFDLCKGELGFCPVKPGDFTGFWAVDGAWGLFERRGDESRLTVLYGELNLSKLCLPYLHGVSAVSHEGARFEDGALVFSSPVTLGENEAVFCRA